MSDPFLRIEGLHKRFVGVHALRGAELTVERGEVHALVGANGSGKSTLINILSGQVAPDAGTITLGGERVRLGRSEHSLAAGIATVTQETTLVPQLSVADARRLIADGTISGGMIPKVETCIYSLEQGVEGVVIIDGKTPHAVLLELFTNQGTGTLIHK